MQYYDHDAFAHCRAPAALAPNDHNVDDAADSDDERICVVRFELVTTAILNAEWLAYAVAVKCIGDGLQQLTMFTRGCVCHPHGDSVLGAVDGRQGRDTHRAQVKRETGEQFCPAAGLVASDLAHGVHGEFLAVAEQDGFAAVLEASAGVGTENKERVLRDFHTGMETAVYIATLKFTGSWQQLQLLLFGLGRTDERKARSAAWEAQRQFQASISAWMARHKLVRALFVWEGDLQMQFQMFCSGTSRQQLPVLAVFIRPLRMVRCNEMSLERLHAIGSKVEKRALCAAPVFISHRLRLQELYLFDLQELANVCSQVRNDFTVLQTFKLWRHPAILAWKNVQLSRGRQLVCGKFGSHTKWCESASTGLTYRPCLLSTVKWPPQSRMQQMKFGMQSQLCIMTIWLSSALETRLGMLCGASMRTSFGDSRLL